MGSENERLEQSQEDRKLKHQVNRNGLETEFRNIIQSSIDHSGNSDVDVQINIQVDVKPIAFAILYSLLATKQLSNRDFENALKKLDEYS